jgi:hypothetical protein
MPIVLFNVLVSSWSATGCGEGRLIEHIFTTAQECQASSSPATPVAPSTSCHRGPCDEQDASSLSLKKQREDSVDVRKLADMQVYGLDVSEGGLKSALKRLSKLPTGMIAQPILEPWVVRSGPPANYLAKLEDVKLSSLDIPPVTADQVVGAYGGVGVTPGANEAQAATRDHPLGVMVINPAAVRLYLGSAFTPTLQEPAAWGDLHGCDVATMVEVIEHLDPPLLE